MNIFFDTKNLYYLPQYLPVIDELISRGHQCECIVYEDKNDKKSINVDAFSNLKTPLRWVSGESAAMNYYCHERPDWIFFGNQCAHLNDLHRYSKTAQLGHGIGPKPSYYSKSKTPMTVRFIEGSERLLKIRSQFPEDEFVQVGYSKLDPLFSGVEKGFDLNELGLNPAKKTILYAPTFNPSSIECFPDNWPEHFSEQNILIKAHAFTWQRKRYHSQRKKLLKWSKFDNVHVAGADDFSLLPFMATADVLLSEASSTLFEFIALDRPVVVCDFYFLKWFYRGPFKYRFERRFQHGNILYKNVGVHADAYEQLKDVVLTQLETPSEYHQQRMEMTEKHVGKTDGQASQRIADYIEAATH